MYAAQPRTANGMPMANGGNTALRQRAAGTSRTGWKAIIPHIANVALFENRDFKGFQGMQRDARKRQSENGVSKYGLDKSASVALGSLKSFFDPAGVMNVAFTLMQRASR